MNRTTLAATAAAVLLLLTGCTAGQATGDDTGSSAAPTASTAPLTAETPAEAADSGEAAFLDEVREKLRPDNVIPNATDQQLLEAGMQACQGITDGVDTLTLSLIEGEPIDASGFYPDSGVIIVAARGTLC